MASSTIFSQGAVTGSTGSGDYTLSMQFAVSGDVSLTGIWYYSVGTTLPASCVIFNADTSSMVSGTENTSPTWSGAAGSGWIKCTYDGSVTLHSGTHYYVSVGHSGTFEYTEGYWTTGGAGASGLTSGPLSAPSFSSSLSGQDVYAATSNPPVFPNSSDSGAPNYWVDVEVTSGTTVTGVAGNVLVRGGVGAPAVSVNGVAAQVVVNGVAGTPAGSASVTGVAAHITVGAGTGTPAGGSSANVNGVAGLVTIRGGAGHPSVSVQGLAAHVTVQGGDGASISSGASILGSAARVVVLGGIGFAGVGVFPGSVMIADSSPGATVADRLSCGLTVTDMSPEVTTTDRATASVIIIDKAPAVTIGDIS